MSRPAPRCRVVLAEAESLIVGAMMVADDIRHCGHAVTRWTPERALMVGRVSSPVGGGRTYAQIRAEQADAAESGRAGDVWTRPEGGAR